MDMIHRVTHTHTHFLLMAYNLQNMHMILSDNSTERIDYC